MSGLWTRYLGPNAKSVLTKKDMTETKKVNKNWTSGLTEKKWLANVRQIQQRLERHD